MWNAPDVLDLFERDMNRGMDELSENPRYAKAIKGAPDESPLDIANLIVHVLASHAISAFGAAEATLSRAAMDFLESATRLTTDEMKTELAKLKEGFLPANPPDQVCEMPGEWGPVVKGAGLGIVGGVAAGIAANKILLMAVWSSSIMGLAVGSAVCWITWDKEKRKDQEIILEKCTEVVGKRPSAIIDFLEDELRKAVQLYEQRINHLAEKHAKEPR